MKIKTKNFERRYLKKNYLKIWEKAIWYPVSVLGYTNNLQDKKFQGWISLRIPPFLITNWKNCHTGFKSPRPRQPFLLYPVLYEADLVHVSKKSKFRLCIDVVYIVYSLTSRPIHRLPSRRLSHQDPKKSFPSLIITMFLAHLRLWDYIIRNSPLIHVHK